MTASSFRHGIITLLTGVTLSVTSLADTANADGDSNTSPVRLSIYIENDSGYVKPNGSSDRYYTSGVRIVIDHQPDWATSASGFIDQLFSLPGEGTTSTSAGYSIGHHIYTPDDLSRSDLITTDRPYAGWLYGSVHLQRTNKSTLDHFELQLGVVGPSSQGASIQKWVHKHFSGDRPFGWDNQLGDEVGVNFIYRRKWKIVLHDRSDWSAELIPQAGFAVGTVNRHIDAAATIRFGVNLPDDFGPGRLEDLAGGTHLKGQRKSKWSLYGFVRVSGRWVNYNIFIDGNSFRSGHGVAREDWVADVQAGIVFRYGRFEFAYSQVFITQEFKTQDGGHDFGTITLSYTCNF